MKILHLPTTVGGHSSGLSKDLKTRGFDSEVWTLNQNYLNYEVDRSITKSTDGPFARVSKLIAAGSYIFKKWDVVHFNSGSTLYSVRFSDFKRNSFVGLSKSTLNLFVSLLQRIELSVLKFRGVKMFVHYQGDDARQGDYSLRNYEISIATQVNPDYYTADTDEFKRSQIKLLSSYCEKVYAVNPDLLNVLPSKAEFIPYSHVDLDEWQPIFNQLEQRTLRFLHAPSNRLVKGTDQIIGDLDSLSKEGYNYELTLVEGLSNQKARVLYEECDVVIDQLYAGWYGGFAVEAMALGKPVMAYIRKEDLKHIPSQMKVDLPIILTSPQTFQNDARKILEMSRTDLFELARRSRLFVEKWHNPETITDRLVQDYEEALKHQ